MTRVMGRMDGEDAFIVSRGPVRGRRDMRYPVHLLVRAGHGAVSTPEVKELGKVSGCPEALSRGPVGRGVGVPTRNLCPHGSYGRQFDGR